ncbi:MAG: DUF971 domain-containing protein [Planctomycetaceae bacterium]
MSNPPVLFLAHRDRRIFEVGWEGDLSCSIPFKTLRCACPCAVCVDEMTGVRLLKPEDVSEDIAPVRLEPAGNYAIRIAWSDGHSTGIYTWDRLRDLAGRLPS